MEASQSRIRVGARSRNSLGNVTSMTTGTTIINGLISEDRLLMKVEKLRKRVASQPHILAVKELEN